MAGLTRRTRVLTLMAGVALAGFAVLLATRLPLMPCPLCKGGTMTLVDQEEPPEDQEPIPCPRCGDRSLITLMNRWLWKPTPNGGPPSSAPLMGGSTSTAALLESLSAEEIFASIEESLATAKTVRLKFRYSRELGQDLVNFEGDGLLLLKQDARAYVLFRRRDEGKGSFLRTISDGRRIRAKWDWQEFPKEWATPGNFQRNLAAQIVRVGVLTFPNTPLDHSGALEPKDPLVVSELRKGEDDQEARTLTYRIIATGTGQFLEAKLWYDPGTLKLLRHRLTTRISRSTVVLNETYDEFSLNIDLPDKKFVIPEK